MPLWIHCFRFEYMSQVWMTNPGMPCTARLDCSLSARAAWNSPYKRLQSSLSLCSSRYSPAKLYCPLSTYIHTRKQNMLFPHIMCGWWSLRFHFSLYKGKWGLGLGQCGGCAGESIKDDKLADSKARATGRGQSGQEQQLQRGSIWMSRSGNVRMLWGPPFIKLLYSELFSSVVMNEFAKSSPHFATSFLGVGAGQIWMGVQLPSV